MNLANAVLQITVSSSLTGALLLGLVFRRSGRSLFPGLLLGACAGVLGPQLFMVPIGYCAFEASNAQTFALHVFDWHGIVNASTLIGWLLVFGGTFIGLLAADRVHWRYRRTGHLMPRSERSPRQYRGWIWLPWLLLAPTLVLSLLTSYVPFFQTFRLATRLSRLGVEQSIPVCLGNFAQLIAGPRENAAYYVLSEGHILHIENAKFVSVIGVSLLYTTSITILANSASLLVAFLTQDGFQGSDIYRTLLIWPSALSPVVVGTLFVLVFSRRVGIINVVLVQLGLPEIGWLQEPQLAPAVIAIAGTWNLIGFNTLLYIAGLRNISKDLLEAAAIDGASRGQQFFYVTLPQLSPVINFVVFSNLTYTVLDLFGLIDRLTLGGPLGATSNLIYEVYSSGIINRDLGRAAAQSIVLMTIVVGLTYTQYQTLRRRMHHGEE